MKTWENRVDTYVMCDSVELLFIIFENKTIIQLLFFHSNQIIAKHDVGWLFCWPEERWNDRKSVKRNRNKNYSKHEMRLFCSALGGVVVSSAAVVVV